MTTSGTYNWAPEIAEFQDEAFERAGIDPATLTALHTRSARMSLNLMFSEWATKGLMPFVVEQVLPVITTTAAQVSYFAPAGTLAILDPILTRSGVSTPIHVISRSDYQNIPNKTQQGLPVNLFFDRPTLEMKAWPVPENSTDTISYWRLRRAQDVTAGYETPDVPYHLYEALASGLSAKLALKFNAAKFALLEGLANANFADAKAFERERVSTSFEMPRI